MQQFQTVLGSVHSKQVFLPHFINLMGWKHKQQKLKQTKHLSCRWQVSHRKYIHLQLVVCFVAKNPIMNQASAINSLQAFQSMSLFTLCVTGLYKLSIICVISLKNYKYYVMAMKQFSINFGVYLGNGIGRHLKIYFTCKQEQWRWYNVWNHYMVRVLRGFKMNRMCKNTSPHIKTIIYTDHTLPQPYQILWIVTLNQVESITHQVMWLKAMCTVF
jgi:hypothetical protein